MEEYYTTAEVAAILEVSPQTVRNMTADGRLRCITTKGGHRRYLRSEIEGRVHYFSQIVHDNDRKISYHVKHRKLLDRGCRVYPPKEHPSGPCHYEIEGDPWAGWKLIEVVVGLDGKKLHEVELKPWLGKTIVHLDKDGNFLRVENGRKYAPQHYHNKVVIGEHST